MAEYAHFSSTSPLCVYGDKEQGSKVIMAYGNPVVETSFHVKELQEYLQTLEKAIEEEPNFIQKMALERLRIALLVVYTKHKEEHDDALASAPTSDDLAEYLMFYSASVKADAIKH